MKDKIERWKEFNWMYILIFLIFFTSSFDIFLTVDILGFTFRISQILCMFLFVCAFIKIIKNKRANIPIGFGELIGWVTILLLFTFNTIYPIMNLGYHLWLIFNVLIIISFTQICKPENSKIILKLYILSFGFMAIVGILQALTGILGIENPFISQWWIKGVLPRVNGFCFEPSYYATYMLIGWTMTRILAMKEDMSKKINVNIHLTLFLITIAIIFSSSRIGIGLMLLMEGLIYIRNLYYAFIKKEEVAKREILFISIIAIIVMIAIIILIGKMDLTFLLQGTGINGTSSHSVTERAQNLQEVLQVYKQSPILGKGLGGIYAEIANNKGLDVHQINPQEKGTAICSFAEVLAASGIIGFAIFIWYVLDIIVKPLKQTKKMKEYNKYIMVSMVIALIMEFIILQFNQNILRPYLWIHIAMLSSFYNIYKGENENENSN